MLHLISSPVQGWQQMMHLDKKQLVCPIGNLGSKH
jgi:hypothetical protein